jgi:hypothetical protein
MKVLTVLVLVFAVSACAQMRHRHMVQKAGGDTVFVCHKGKKTLEIPREAAEAHIAHGDWYGRC